MANYAVATVIVLSVILIGLLLIRPSITAAQGGKIVAFIAFFILPVVATVLGASIHLENSTSTQPVGSSDELSAFPHSRRNPVVAGIAVYLIAIVTA